MAVARWNEAGPLKLEWFDFALEAAKWINDMQTVVFDFRRENLAGGMMSLCFARDLLKLMPDEFEYFDIGDRMYVRIWWERESMTSEAIWGASESASPDARP